MNSMIQIRQCLQLGYQYANAPPADWKAKQERMKQYDYQSIQPSHKNSQNLHTAPQLVPMLLPHQNQDYDLTTRPISAMLVQPCQQSEGSQKRYS